MLFSRHLDHNDSDASNDDRGASEASSVIQKKIALLGASGVGKTSLVRRFVDSLFDDKYLTTIGVKVDKKPVRVGAEDVTLMIWDVAGAEEHFSVPMSYVRGAAAYLLVADGTRPETIAAAAAIVQQIERDLGPLPFIVVINKKDLVDAWRGDGPEIDALSQRSLGVLPASAKTGEGVNEAFQQLADALVPR
jgi:small GTP-binding protein